MRKLGGITRRQFSALLGAKLGILAATGWVFASPKDHFVIIRRFQFEPSDLEVKIGDTITWENQDTAPHTATSNDETWDTGRLKKLQRMSVTFDQAGAFEYFCRYHPHMKATINVCDE